MSADGSIERKNTSWVVVVISRWITMILEYSYWLYSHLCLFSLPLSHLWKMGVDDQLELRRWRMLLERVKGNKIHHFRSLTSPPPYLKTALAVLGVPGPLWGMTLSNLKTFRKGPLFSSWNPLRMCWTQGLESQSMPLASNILITSLKFRSSLQIFPLLSLTALSSASLLMSVVRKMLRNVTKFL